DSNLLGDLNGSAAIAITGVTEAGLQGEVVLDGTEAERAQSEGNLAEVAKGGSARPAPDGNRSRVTGNGNGTSESGTE
ncbi:hypothetical protein, partial [Halegenticoccus soli]|uniref:hypothetical protein n=1 Tax=Halegenticoccus soli TaxID=1985678 RepID=UPI0013046BAB